MPIHKQIQTKQTQQSITNRLVRAGIKVQSGKKTQKKGEYSGIISNRNEILKLKI